MSADNVDLTDEEALGFALMYARELVNEVVADEDRPVASVTLQVYGRESFAPNIRTSHLPEPLEGRTYVGADRVLVISRQFAPQHEEASA